MPEIRQRRKKKNDDLLTNDSQHHQLQSDKKYSISWSWINIFVGCALSVYCGYKHAYFMAQLHDNLLWFSNIQVSIF